MEELDVAIIGAGVIGLSIAERLSRNGASVAVFERHRRHGVETSSRNSEVVHSGIYYPKDSLKARFCARGREMIYALARNGDFFCRKSGKLIVACAPEEIPQLEALKSKGEANGVGGLELIDGEEAARKSPGVAAVAALWSPETGIVDSEELMGYFLKRAEAQGAMFVWNSQIEDMEKSASGYRLKVKGAEPVAAKFLINCAGLESDTIAQKCGIDIDAAGYRLHWFKGEYFRIRSKFPEGPLIYPVPAKHGLGIHLTLDRENRGRLGPNAFAVARQAEQDYTIDVGHCRQFWEAASRYLPDLREEDLSPDTAGIRPKLAADGSFRDFVVNEESARGLPGLVNLIGIESPGLTASLAIADYVASLIDWH